MGAQRKKANVDGREREREWQRKGEQRSRGVRRLDEHKAQAEVRLKWIGGDDERRAGQSNGFQCNGADKCVCVCVSSYLLYTENQNIHSTRKVRTSLSSGDILAGPHNYIWHGRQSLKAMVRIQCVFSSNTLSIRSATDPLSFLSLHGGCKDLFKLCNITRQTDSPRQTQNQRQSDREL